MQKTVREHIAEERMKRNLSIPKLAKMAGISHTALYKIEHGIHSPSERTINKIAKALDMPSVMFWL